jgi:hypothetical protein
MSKMSFKHLVMTALFIVLSNAEAQAATKSQIVTQCSQALVRGDKGEATNLAAEIALFVNIFNKGMKAEAIECLNMVYGAGWYYDETSGSFLNDDDATMEELLVGRSKAEVDAYTSKVKSARGAIEERLLREKEIKLEKQSGCVDAAILQTERLISAIDVRMNEANQSLIIRDTHKACSSLYADDQTAAMLNQSCIEAFKTIGHPEFSSKEDETYAALEDKLIELMAAKLKVVKSLTETTGKLLVVSGAVMEGGREQAITEELALKSCAEFGYKYVYLD